MPGMEGMDPAAQQRQRDAMQRQQERTMENRFEKQQQLKGQEAGKDNKPGGDFALFDSLIGSENPETWQHQHAKEIMETGYDPANAKSFWEASNWDKANKHEDNLLKELVGEFKNQIGGPGAETTNRADREYAAEQARRGFSLIGNIFSSPPKTQEAANNNDAFELAA